MNGARNPQLGRSQLAVCTNKREVLTLKLLKALKLDAYFAAIAGRDTFAVAKPHPEHLTGVIARARGTPARAVMVGDSEVDLATAKAARVKAILVSFGYAAQPLDALAPNAVIDDFRRARPPCRDPVARCWSVAPPPAPQICLISTGVLSTKGHSQSPASPALNLGPLAALSKEKCDAQTCLYRR